MRQIYRLVAGIADLHPVGHIAVVRHQRLRVSGRDLAQQHTLALRRLPCIQRKNTAGLQQIGRGSHDQPYHNEHDDQATAALAPRLPICFGLFLRLTHALSSVKITSYRIYQYEMNFDNTIQYNNTPFSPNFQAPFFEYYVNPQK